MSIFDLGLSRRAVSRLYSSGILTAEELMQKPDIELMKIRGFGAGCLAEVKDALYKHGYTRKKTNADRIRAMSDEELAEFLAIINEKDECFREDYKLNVCYKCPMIAFCTNCKCGDELEWLQQPAEEG